MLLLLLQLVLQGELPLLFLQPLELAFVLLLLLLLHLLQLLVLQLLLQQPLLMEGRVLLLPLSMLLRHLRERLLLLWRRPDRSRLCRHGPSALRRRERVGKMSRS